MSARRDVTEDELRRAFTRGTAALCPDCGGRFWWPFIRCLGKVPEEREVGTDDGVIEYVRECPREGRGPA